MKESYRPKTLVAKLGYLVEECGEVQAAVGKTLRHGLGSYNPELEDPADREVNRDWIVRELRDLRQAMAWAEEALLAWEPDADDAPRKAPLGPWEGNRGF